MAGAGQGPGSKDKGGQLGRGTLTPDEKVKGDVRLAVVVHAGVQADDVQPARVNVLFLPSLQPPASSSFCPASRT